MPYLDEHLNPGETVVFRTNLHFIKVLPSIIIGGLASIGAIGALAAGAPAGILPMMLAIVIGSLFIGYIPYRTNEFGVTTQRVIVKTGWLNVRTLELQLNKVEAISVDQTWIGKAYGYGTLIVSGSGGTKEAFAFIAQPLEFRKAVQGQAEKQEVSARIRHNAPPASFQVAAPAGRPERDCPSCAERILAAAKICKHCGRDVPLTT